VANVGGNNYVMVATARYGRGFVFAIGDSSPIDDGTGYYNDNLYNGWTEDASGNHRKMIMNASIWALERTLSQAPNLASESQNLNVSVLRNEVKITGNISGNYQIYDVSGRLIKSGRFDRQLNLIGLRPGIYIIRVAGQTAVTQKFTVY
jgi:uncharacterized protein YcfL